MPLGSTWWNNLGEASMWLDDWTGLDGLISTAYENWVACGLGKCIFFQAPYSIWSSGGTQDFKDPGYDTGFFYLDNQSNADVWYGLIAHLAGIPKASPSQAPQYVELDPICIEGDFQPHGEDIAEDNAAYLRTPYLYDNGPNYPDEWLTDMGCIIWFQGSPGTYDMWHYAPFAWNGTVPEVIASIAMQAGVPIDSIDSIAFDNAYDAYLLSGGDVPWLGLDSVWEIYCSRKVGTTVIDLILEVAEHSRDFIFMNPAGQLSISSYTRPNNVITGLGYTDDDGVLDEVQAELTDKYLFNSLYAGWGTGFRTFNFDTLPPDETGFSVAEEKTLESTVYAKWIAEDDDSDSVDKFDARWLRGKKRTINLRGQPEEIIKSHYPMLLSLHISTNSMVHVEHWLDEDSVPKMEIVVKQSPVGLNYGPGDQIDDVELTSDGKTITSMTCIAKEVNFDDLTCISTLLTKEA